MHSCTSGWCWRAKRYLYSYLIKKDSLDYITPEKPKTFLNWWNEAISSTERFFLEPRSKFIILVYVLCELCICIFESCMYFANCVYLFCESFMYFVNCVYVFCESCIHKYRYDIRKCRYPRLPPPPLLKTSFDYGYIHLYIFIWLCV